MARKKPVPPPPPPPKSAVLKRGGTTITIAPGSGTNKGTGAGTTLDPHAPGVAKTKSAVRSTVQPALFTSYRLYLETLGRTLSDVWETGLMKDGTPICECVSFRHLEQTSADNKWSLKRKEFWDGIHRRVLERAESELVDREISEMAEMATLKERAKDMMLAEGDDAVKPKSWEGVAAAYSRIDKDIERKRDRALRFVTAAATEAGIGTGSSRPAGSGAMVPNIGEDRISEDEIEALAIALAAARVDKGATRPATPEDEHGEE